MADYPAIELAAADKHGGGNMTCTLYRVEVRTSYTTPTVIGAGRDKFIIDHCWRVLPVFHGPTPFGINIPVSRLYREGVDCGLVNYEAAEALRWSFLAHLEAEPLGGLCIETRLVAVKFMRTYSTEEIGVSEPLREIARNKPAFGPRRVDPSTSEQAVEASEAQP